jgi:Ku protein
MATKPRNRGAVVRSIASASISFGLVSIPVRIVSTSEPTHEVHFHMIHAGCGERVKQQYVCPKHGPVERADIAKGYELNQRSMIELSNDELDTLDAVADETIALAEFVPAAAVDPIFVERTYYLGPGKGGARPYRLLRDALAAAELVGIARYAARGKSYVVMVRPFDTGLALHQLRYADEIKPWSAAAVGELPAPTASELTLAPADRPARARAARYDRVPRRGQRPRARVARDEGEDRRGDHGSRGSGAGEHSGSDGRAQGIARRTTFRGARARRAHRITGERALASSIERRRRARVVACTPSPTWRINPGVVDVAATRFSDGTMPAPCRDMASTEAKAGFGIAWLLGIPLPILVIVYLISRC